MTQDMTNPRIIPVILCGGSGTRLWPLSRPENPKQFLKLFSDLSLVQETVMRAQRASSVPPQNFVCVTMGNTYGTLKQQLDDLGTGYSDHILREPCARNTAAAVALAATYIEEEFGDDAVMWVLPSDHFIADEKTLAASLRAAVNAADTSGALATFGIQPSSPHTGYGYIRITGQTICNGAYKADSFVEKPDVKTAQEYKASGEYLWNSGMFVFKVSDILDHFEEYAEDILNLIQTAIHADEKNPDAETYAKIQNTPFDKAVMEKSKHVAVIPCDMGWSDIGSWDSLWDVLKQNGGGDVLFARKQGDQNIQKQRTAAAS